MVYVVLLLIIAMNTVFGYWRANTRALSLRWLLAIHVPVATAIGLRFCLLGWSWPMAPAFVAAFALGQFTGARIRRRLSMKWGDMLGSFMLFDLVRVMAAVQQEKGSNL